MSRSERPARVDLRTRRASIALIAAAVMAVAACAPPTADAPRADRSRGGTGRGASPAVSASTAPVDGVVLDVHDGDSFTVHTADGRRLRIRLAGIDAPELGQPSADAARDRLIELLGDGRVHLEPVKVDPFGRTVSRAWASDRSPDHELGIGLVRAGMAWHFTRYKADQTASEFDRFSRAERAARSARRGLWQDPAPEAPWDFRSRTRRQDPRPGPAAPERRPSPGRAD